MAAQDFRHASQEENEKVGDFIRRLEQLFKVAYGHDAISADERDTPVQPASRGTTVSADGGPGRLRGC